MCKGANLVARKMMARIDVFPLMLLSPHVLKTITIAAEIHDYYPNIILSIEIVFTRVLSVETVFRTKILCISIAYVLVVRTWEKAIRELKSKAVHIYLRKTRQPDDAMMRLEKTPVF